jgi:hypothetical protein
METLYSTHTQCVFNSLPGRFATSRIAIRQSGQQSAVDQVLIFKTGIQTQKDRLFIKPILDNHAFIEQWNLDMEDVDCVLRIVSSHLKHKDIIELVTWCGFYCDELI